MSTLAKDMDRWIEKRDDLSRKMEDIRKQKKTALKREVSKHLHDSGCDRKFRTIILIFVDAGY